MNELDLFTEAMNRTDLAERAALLDQACAVNPDLRRRLEGLLAGYAQSGSPLDRPPVAPADLLTPIANGEHHPGRATGAFAHTDPDTTTAPESEASAPPPRATGEDRPDGATEALDRPESDATTAAALETPTPRAARITTGEGIGTVIAGRYTLVEVIGEGGMGSVYLASQTEPVKRQVALKLIKTGMDSNTVLARFDAERQALALMDHPNIARIYDGGLTPSGQPFFVMELVMGVPLTEYCDRQRLTMKARLELFVAVCQAVQHAHQKGIIHRDLKPGNVLVTEVDGRPTPKVIDFGVAKATEVKLTDMSLADVGAIVGTPAYMSPEQADPSSMDIDTRTDVYGLGVMLYELLTGSPPIDARQFQRGAVLEMLRMVREVDPPRPSTKRSTAEALPNIAANRNIEPARLAKLLQGELDWVVMKALEKDCTRRYETANGFARDIQRYLADEVVEARPASRGYRLKKFVKRNKGQVIAASLVFLTLVGGIIGTSLGMASARRAQKAEADQRANAVVQRDKAIAAEIKAREEAAKSRTINDFLTQDLLTQAEPANNAVEDKVTLLEILDRAAEKVGTRFADQPELERSLRVTIAGTYHGLASWEKAETQVRASLDAARRRDPQSAEVYLDQGFLAHVLLRRGRQDAEVLAMTEAAVKGLDRTLGPDHPDTLTTLQSLASAYKAASMLPEAIAMLERVRDARIAKLGPDHPDTPSALNNLATAYETVGQIPEAIALFERVRDARIAKVGPDHPSTLTTLDNLAVAYAGVGKFPEAIAMHERIRDARIARLGPDHPDTLTTLNHLGFAYREAGKHPQAIALFERVRDARIAKLGPDHPDTLFAINNLAAAYWSTKQLDKSVPLFEDVLKRKEAKLGRQHVETQRTVANLGVNNKDAGRLKEAIPLLEEAHQAAKSFQPLRWVADPLIDAYTKLGENAKLDDLLQEELAEVRKTLPKDSPQLAGLLAQIGLSLLQKKKWTEAEPLLHECLAIREKTQLDVWSTFNTKSQLGGSLLGQKKYADSEPLLLKGYEGMKQREKAISPQAQTS